MGSVAHLNWTCCQKRPFRGIGKREPTNGHKKQQSTRANAPFSSRSTLWRLKVGAIVAVVVVATVVDAVAAVAVAEAVVPVVVAAVVNMTEARAILNRTSRPRAPSAHICTICI